VEQAKLLFEIDRSMLHLLPLYGSEYISAALRSLRSPVWRLTFDMSGGPNCAKRPLDRPLDEYEGTSHLRQRRRSAKIGGVQVINLKPLKGEVRGADYTR
jgi:hypothetical protein